MSEGAQLDDSDSKPDDVEELVSEASVEMDVDSVFETYDANSDGKIEHSEYVAKHKGFLPCFKNGFSDPLAGATP